MGERRIGEHAVWDQSAGGAAVSTGEILLDNEKVIYGHMGELRASGAFANGPDSGHCRFQTLVDADVAPLIQCDTGVLQPNTFRVRGSPDCRHDIAGLDQLLAMWGVHRQGHRFARSASDVQDSAT